jgi:putative flippase GtrA
VPTREVQPVPTAEARVFRVPDIRRAQREDWHQLVRFCAVGATGYFVNLALFTLLVHGAGAHYAISAVLAFCVAWTNNFLWNKYWTFRRHGLSAAQQGARYLAVSLVALGLNLLLLELLVQAGSPEVPAQAVSIAAVMPVNFLLNRRWSFR